MGCGCGGKKAGTSEDFPLVVGLPTGAPAALYTLRVSYGDYASGNTIWLTGLGVQLWLDREWIEVA